MRYLLLDMDKPEAQFVSGIWDEVVAAKGKSLGDIAYSIGYKAGQEAAQDKDWPYGDGGPT